MGKAIRVDDGGRGSNIRMLSRSGERPFGSQRTNGEVLSMSEVERLAKLEGKAEAYDKMFHKMSDTLNSINEAVNKLVALEERHQALDQRHVQLREDFSSSAERQGERLGSIEDRIRDVEGASRVSTHDLSVRERLLLPLFVSLVSALTVAVAGYILVGKAVGAG